MAYDGGKMKQLMKNHYEEEARTWSKISGMERQEEDEEENEMRDEWSKTKEVAEEEAQEKEGSHDAEKGGGRE